MNSVTDDWQTDTFWLIVPPTLPDCARWSPVTTLVTEPHPGAGTETSLRHVGVPVQRMAGPPGRVDPRNWRSLNEISTLRSCAHAGPASTSTARYRDFRSLVMRRTYWKFSGATICNIKRAWSRIFRSGGA